MCLRTSCVKAFEDSARRFRSVSAPTSKLERTNSGGFILARVKTPSASPVANKAPSPVVEDYLQILHYMSRDGIPLIAARLAERLNVTPPTVTATLQRMER